LYVKKFYPNAKKIYAFGTSILADELSHVGAKILSSQDHNDKYGMSHHDAVHMEADGEIDVVVQAYDDNINLYKLALASYALQKNVI
jgi:ribonucleotide monophosphatase NagD (HAD superfamily)